MSLPSTRRPQFVEEELKIECKSSLKIKVEKKDIFMGRMIEWYRSLPNKHKRSLTPKKLKKRAVVELYKLSFPYIRLPKDWVKKLMDSTGMVLYERQKNYVFNDDNNQIVNISMKPIDADSDSDSELEAAVNVNVHGAGTGSLEKDRPSTSSYLQTFHKKLQDKIEEAKNDVESIHKKFIDLSAEPPPPYWLKAYSEGRHLPRALTIFSGDGVNVLFYDYDPKFQEGNIFEKYSPAVHEATGFNWFQPKMDIDTTVSPSPPELTHHPHHPHGDDDDNGNTFEEDSSSLTIISLSSDNEIFTIDENPEYFNFN